MLRFAQHDNDVSRPVSVSVPLMARELHWNCHSTFRLGVALPLFLALLSLAHALEIPSLRGRINDYAGLLPKDRAQALESRLAAFESETGHQIALLTLPSLEGEALEDFSIRVAESWKIGKKGFDNGAILLIAQKDRKLRIEVGYGLEGVLPDAIANRIIQEVIVPRFRNGDFPGGIEAGLDAILQVTKGERLPPTARTDRGSGSARLGSVMSVLTITAIIALLIGMTRRRIAGGSIGGAAAGFAASFLGVGGSWLILMLALATGALLGAIGATMSVASAGNYWTGGSRYRRSGWGGIYPGGFGGGGFSGGGGGFGGGGASGSW
jgi:uncharacterized protein